MPGSTKGLVVYNSAGYNTLCFAKMMKSYGRSFSAIQLKECLRGVFHETGISRTKEQLKSLEKNGYISRASEDEWLITENGIEQIFKSAAVYRGQKERFLGKRYVANTNKQISNIAKSDSLQHEGTHMRKLMCPRERFQRNLFASVRSLKCRVMTFFQV